MWGMQCVWVYPPHSFIVLNVTKPFKAKNQRTNTVHLQENCHSRKFNYTLCYDANEAVCGIYNHRRLHHHHQHQHYHHHRFAKFVTTIYHYKRQTVVPYENDIVLLECNNCSMMSSINTLSLCSCSSMGLAVYMVFVVCGYGLMVG